MVPVSKYYRSLFNREIEIIFLPGEVFLNF